MLLWQHCVLHQTASKWNILHVRTDGVSIYRATPRPGKFKHELKLYELQCKGTLLFFFFFFLQSINKTTEHIWK